MAHSSVAKWIADAEAIWNAKRDKKAGKQTLYERLDYQNELSSQNLTAKHMVLYNAAGTNLAAAHVVASDLPMPFVVEHKLYWASFSAATEADYLTAILNSEQANREIKPFQTRGQQGERDIEKKILDLPIPLFDAANETHRRIAELGKQAAELAATLTLPKTRLLGLARGYVRRKLSEILNEIDGLVATLW